MKLAGKTSFNFSETWYERDERYEQHEPMAFLNQLLIYQAERGFTGESETLSHQSLEAAV